MKSVEYYEIPIHPQDKIALLQVATLDASLTTPLLVQSFKDYVTEVLKRSRNSELYLKATAVEVSMMYRVVKHYLSIEVLPEIFLFFIGLTEIRAKVINERKLTITHKNWFESGA
jgi:hypothetical protein